MSVNTTVNKKEFTLPNMNHLFEEAKRAHESIIAKKPEEDNSILQQVFQTHSFALCEPLDESFVSSVSEKGKLLLPLFDQQHEKQRELSLLQKQKAEDARVAKLTAEGKDAKPRKVRPMIHATNHGIFGADFHVGGKSLVATVPFSKDSLSWDKMACEKIKELNSEKIDVFPVPSPFVTNAPCFKKDQRVWRFLHGTDACPLVGFLTLTEVDVYLCLHDYQKFAKEWEKLTFGGESHELKTLKSHVLSQKMTAKLNEEIAMGTVFAITLPPGQFVVTHRGMPVCFHRDESDERFLVKTFAFTTSASQREAYEKFFESNSCFKAGLFEENFFVQMLPSVVGDQKPFVSLDSNTGDIWFLKQEGQKKKMSSSSNSSSDEEEKKVVVEVATTPVASKKKKTREKSALDAQIERAASLKSELDVLNPRLLDKVRSWQNIQDDLDSIGKLKAEQKELPDPRNLRTKLSLLEKKLKKAKESEEDIFKRLKAMETKLDELDAREDLQKCSAKTEYVKLATSMRKLIHEKNNLSVGKDLEKAEVQLNEFYDQVDQKIANASPLSSSTAKGGKRTRQELVIPIVDPDQLEDRRCDTMEDISPILGECTTLLSEFQVMVQSIGKDEATELYTNFAHHFQEKAAQYQAAYAGEIEADDEDLLDMTKLLGYKNALNTLSAQYAGSNNANGVKKAQKIKCSECEMTKENFENSGTCIKCYADAGFQTLRETVENREKALTDIPDGWEDLFEEYDTAATLFEEKPTKDHWASFQQVYEKVDALLPSADTIPTKKVKQTLLGDEDDDEEYDEDEEEEEEEDEDEPDPVFTTNSRRKKLGSWADIKRIGIADVIDEDDEDEDEQNVANRKRPRDESASDASLAHDTLKCMHAIPVSSIHKELITLYQDEKLHDALRARIQLYKATLKKVYGVRVQDISDASLEPFEHDTCFENQADAIQRRNEYNSTGEVKAEVFVKEVVDF